MDTYGGFDLGGTRGRYTAFRSSTEPEPLDTVEFVMSKHTEESPGDFEADYANMANAIGKMAARHGRLGGIGLAVAGRVDERRTRITAAGNLGHWAYQPVVDRLTSDFGCEVILGNDAEAGGLAEALYGHGQGRDFWFAIHGTGFGGCFVSRPETEDGLVKVTPGEPGHQCVNPFGDLRCKCGQMNCLEAYVGGDGIEARLGKKPEALSEEEFRKEVLPWMAFGLRNMLCGSCANLVVFSGGIACNQQWMQTELWEMLGNDLRVVDGPSVMMSKFGESAGTIGSFALLQHHLALRMQ